MAIRYVAAPMLGPNAREERMREERQKTMAKSAESLSRGYLRQVAIDSALDQQRKDAAARAPANLQPQQAGGTLTSVVRPSAPWGGPSVDTARREAGASRAADRADVMGMPMMDPALAALMRDERGAEAVPSPGPSLELGRSDYDPELARRIQESEDAQLVERAEERMFSQQPRLDMEMAERVDARLREEAAERRMLNEDFPESYAGAPPGLPEEQTRWFMGDDWFKRADPSAGQDRMQGVQDAIARIAASSGGYGIASPDASDREGGLPGRYRPAVDFAGLLDGYRAQDSGRAERIGEELAPTSETSMVEGSDQTTSPEMIAEWRKVADEGGRGTLQEGVEAWRLAAAGLGDQWFNHFISGESGASQEVLDEFMALTELSEMPTSLPDDGRQAAKRALGTKRPKLTLPPSSGGNS